MELIPQEPGAGFEFENKVVGGAIPREYIGPVENGVKEAMESGVIAGYPMVDIKVIVFDGSYHDVDSNGNGLQNRWFYGLRKKVLAKQTLHS